jgi:preprotein translocase subunit SecE
MARNRQRAKQRQAQRREARLAERRERQATAPGDGAPAAEDVVDPALLEAELAATAPPEDTGRSDTVVESPPPAPDFETDEELLEEEEAPEPVAARERPEPGRPRQRGKVLAFLANVVAELQRVQWPDRAALTSLTGIVLGFVLIAGGYLGLLDAIFAKLIQAIL